MFVAFSASRSSAFGGLEVVGRHRLGHDPLLGREEERARDGPGEGDHRELPDLGPPGDEEHGRDGLRDARHEVRRDHHEVARQAVGDHAADEEEEDLRQDRERQHEPEIGGGAVEIEDGERECDGRHRRAREGDDAAEEEEPEVPVREAARARYAADSPRLRQ